MIRSMLAAIAGLLAAGGAAAQSPPAAASAAPAAVSADPAQTTATYGDWVLRCVRPGNGATGRRLCEVVQTMMVKGHAKPVAQIAIGNDKTDLRLTLLVPPAVSFSKVPTVSAQGGAAPRFELAWRRCLPHGCFADVAVDAALLKTLRSRTEPLQVAFKDAGERDATLPFSLRGLVPALDALAREPH
jgi:invasion protein IalB